MVIQEILEKLQNAARDISSTEGWFQSNGEKRLAEYSAVWRLVNFKIQNIIQKVPQDEIEKVLLDFNADLVCRMEYFRNNQIMGLSELYGAALDGLNKAREIIATYLP